MFGEGFNKRWRKLPKLDTAGVYTVHVCVCVANRKYAEFHSKPLQLHVILSRLTVDGCVFVCFFCPLCITGMGNQWV